MIKSICDLFTLLMKFLVTLVKILMKFLVEAQSSEAITGLMSSDFYFHFQLYLKDKLMHHLIPLKEKTSYVKKQTWTNQDPYLNIWFNKFWKLTLLCLCGSRKATLQCYISICHGIMFLGTILEDFRDVLLNLA